MREWWESLGVQNQISLAALIVAIIAAVPSYLTIRRNREHNGPSTHVLRGSAANTDPQDQSTDGSLTTLRKHGELELNASYVWSTGGIMWALPRSLISEDIRRVESDGLVGSPEKQEALEALLAERDGVKIGVDSRGDERAHSELRLVVSAGHDPSLLIVGMRAKIIKRARPLSETLVFGPPEGVGENIAIGFDLDSPSPKAQAFDSEMFLAGSYFAKHHVSLKYGEQAVFSIRAFTDKYFCEWAILVDAIIDGEAKVFSVMDGDRPFRTTAFAESYRTVYEFDFMAGRFVRLPPGSKWGGEPQDN